MCLARDNSLAVTVGNDRLWHSWKLPRFVEHAWVICHGLGVASQFCSYGKSSPIAPISSYVLMARFLALNLNCGMSPLSTIMYL